MLFFCLPNRLASRFVECDQKLFLPAITTQDQLVVDDDRRSTWAMEMAIVENAVPQDVTVHVKACGAVLTKVHKNSLPIYNCRGRGMRILLMYSPQRLFEDSKLFNNFARFCVNAHDNEAGFVISLDCRG